MRPSCAYADDRSKTDRLGGQAVASLIFVSLSTFAGAVDACGLYESHDVYASFMSGNTVSLGTALVEGDRWSATILASVTALFVVGAAMGAIISTLLDRLAAAAVLFATAFVLMIPAAYEPAGPLAMAFAMGVLNASMDRVGSQPVGLTYVTGALVKVGLNCGRLACGRKLGPSFALPSLAWVGLLLGSVLATLALRTAPTLAIALLPAVATLLALACWIADLDDPEPTARR